MFAENFSRFSDFFSDRNFRTIILTAWQSEKFSLFVFFFF